MGYDIPDHSIPYLCCPPQHGIFESTSKTTWSYSKTMILSQSAGQRLRSHKHILPQERTTTFCQWPYLPRSLNRLFGGCVNVSDLRWPKLSLAATGNPQKIQPVYFMTWSRLWPENPTKWEAWPIKSHLLNHLPELQPVQFRNNPETEPTHKYGELTVRTSFASQGSCDYGGKHIFSSQFNSWLAKVIDCQV